MVDYKGLITILGKKVFTLAMLLGAATLGMNAQDHVYLIKGNKVVAKYPVGSVDYLSFKLPEGVSISLQKRM